MKKYLFKIALFFAIIAVVDFAFGKVCDYLRDHTKGGFSGNIHYICEESNEDIIMMGSSRMRHHYVPQVFEDSLGLTCYNAGIDGNGIILNYGFLQMILQRYSPKLVVYDITNFDMYESDNAKFLDMLRPYYHKPGIKQIFNDVDTAERLKMLSRLYQYNSDFLGLLGDNVHPLRSFNKGYWPSTKVMDYEPVCSMDTQLPPTDSLKLSYLTKFIDLTRQYNVPLIFVASPEWFAELYPEYNVPVERLCQNENVPFLDYYCDRDFCADKQYWGDPRHLNDKGATIYSQKIVAVINRIVGFKPIN